MLLSDLKPGTIIRASENFNVTGYIRQFNQEGYIRQLNQAVCAMSDRAVYANPKDIFIIVDYYKGLPPFVMLKTLYLGNIVWFKVPCERLKYNFELLTSVDDDQTNQQQ